MSIYHCPNCFQANTCGCYEVHMRECRTPKAVLDASQDRLNAAAVSVKAEGLSLSDRAKKLVKLLSGPQTYLSQDDKEIIESELRAAVDEARKEWEFQEAQRLVFERHEAGNAGYRLGLEKAAQVAERNIESNHVEDIPREIRSLK